MWLAVFLLGCYHGVNPAMGWLFAVALGLQERSSAAVLGAIVPLVLGHLASIALVVLLVVFAATEFPHAVGPSCRGSDTASFRCLPLGPCSSPSMGGHASWLLGSRAVGISRIDRARRGINACPIRDWRVGRAAIGNGDVDAPGSLASSYAIGGLIVSVHTFGYLIALTAVALVIYTKVGVSFLRTAWFNMDIVWAAALLASGAITLLT